MNLCIRVGACYLAWDATDTITAASSKIEECDDWYRQYRQEELAEMGLIKDLAGV